MVLPRRQPWAGAGAWHRWSCARPALYEVAAPQWFLGQRRQNSGLQKFLELCRRAAGTQGELFHGPVQSLEVQLNEQQSPPLYIGLSHSLVRHRVEDGVDEAQADLRLAGLSGDAGGQGTHNLGRVRQSSGQGQRPCGARIIIRKVVGIEAEQEWDAPVVGDVVVDIRAVRYPLLEQIKRGFGIHALQGERGAGHEIRLGKVWVECDDTPQERLQIWVKFLVHFHGAEVADRAQPVIVRSQALVRQADEAQRLGRRQRLAGVLGVAQRHLVERQMQRVERCNRQDQEERVYLHGDG
ncbi:MAG: hypothetical protein HYZ27_00810 [Deltaproteobacteria bacterium]|nr:hypothetical protein [Deltaproteobacteria bacterium]